MKGDKVSVFKDHELSVTDRETLIGHGPVATRLIEKINDDAFLYGDYNSNLELLARQKVKRLFDLSRFIIAESQKQIINDAVELICIVRVLAQNRKPSSKDGLPIKVDTANGTFSIVSAGLSSGIEFDLILDEMKEFVEVNYNSQKHGFVIRHIAENRLLLCGKTIVFKEVAQKTVQLLSEVIRQLWPEYLTFDLLDSDVVYDRLVEIAKHNKEIKKGLKSFHFASTNFFGITLEVRSRIVHKQEIVVIYARAEFDYFTYQTHVKINEAFCGSKAYTVACLAIPNDPARIAWVCKKLFEENVIKYHDGCMIPSNK